MTDKNNKGDKTGTRKSKIIINSWVSRQKRSLFIYVLAGLIILVTIGWLTNCRQKGEKESAAISREAPVSASQAESGSHQHVPGVTAAKSPTEESQKVKQEKEAKTLYHCPMHPNYISDKPGECPICGMTLVPIEEEKKTAEAMPEGMVEISPEKQQLLGVTFGQVGWRELQRMISAYGRLTYDETRLASITTKFSGWVEALYVDYTGKLVKKGQPLFSIYSPDLMAAQEEYLLALRAQETLGLAQKNRHPSQEEAGEGVGINQTEANQAQVTPAKSNLFQNIKIEGTQSNANPGQAGLGSSLNLSQVVEAAKRRLLLWDISEEQIAELQKTGKPFRALTIYSPVTGFVIEKNVVQGKYVMAGETLFSLADLSRLWLFADIYERDLPFISVGTEVAVEIASFPDEILTGKISYIFPYIQNETRTVRVRVEFANPGFRLKPEMYGRIKLHLPLGRRLALPEEAVIDTGERKLVFVVHEGRHFEPRPVQLGVKAGEYYEVLTGLEEGEQVVTSAQFLVDSESRLKAALKGFHEHAGEKVLEPEKAPAKEKAPGKHVH